MIRRELTHLAAVVLALSFGVGASSAHAEVRSGEGADPGMDQAVGGRDLTGLRASYDTTGAIEATVTFRTAVSATSGGVVSVLFGTPTPSGGCGSPSAVILGYLDPADIRAAWSLSSAPSGFSSATKSSASTTVSLRGTGAGLAGAGYSCAIAAVDELDPGTARFDELSTPVALPVPSALAPST